MEIWRTAAEVAAEQGRDALLDAIMRIEVRSYSHPWTRGNFIDSFNNGHHCQLLYLERESSFVADSAQPKLIGYYVVMPLVDDAHLLNITVSPSQQRKGWGTQLLEHAKQWVRSQGLPAMLLEVRASNVAAISLYVANGFEHLAQRKAYYPLSTNKREDACVMRAMLSSLHQAGK